jgi:hypothetical protein
LKVIYGIIKSVKDGFALKSDELPDKSK